MAAKALADHYSQLWSPAIDDSKQHILENEHEYWL